MIIWRKNILQRNSNGSEVGACEAYLSLGVTQCAWRRESNGARIGTQVRELAWVQLTKHCYYWLSIMGSHKRIKSREIISFGLHFKRITMAAM